MIDDIHFPPTVYKCQENVGCSANLNYDDKEPRQCILNSMRYHSILPVLQRIIFLTLRNSTFFNKNVLNIFLSNEFQNHEKNVIHE